MVQSITISDEAAAVIARHAGSNGESILVAVDELVSVADNAWNMDMPEMRVVWKRFKKYNKTYENPLFKK